MSLLQRVQERGWDENQEHIDARAMISEVKNDLMERLTFKGLVGITSQEESQARLELAVALNYVLTHERYFELDEMEKSKLAEEVINDLVGLGPLESLLSNDHVTEIMVNGVQSLYYEHKGKLYRDEHVFSTDDQIRILIDRIIAPLGRRIDEQSPLVNARLSSGYRVHAVIPPIALDGPVLTIRKFSDRISTLDELVKLGSLPAWYAQLLSWCVTARKNIAVVGGTGSGKTTLLNALSCEIDHGERIITIEDSAELKFKEHPHVVRLERRDASIEGIGEVTIRDLVINSLRMRPDRIVVGECRGAEAIDMLQAMNTGHDGSLTTLHAGSAEEAVVRLVMLSRYGIDLPTSVIEDQIATALDFIVMQTRKGDGRRVVSDMSAVSRKPDGGVLLTLCVHYDVQTSQWVLKGEPVDLVQKMGLTGIPHKEVSTWISSMHT